MIVILLIAIALIGYGICAIVEVVARRRADRIIALERFQRVNLPCDVQ